MVTGSIVAIVTPMQDDGQLDLVRFKSLIDWHIREGTDGIVVVGTTGESPTVTVDEHCEIIRVAVEQAAGRLPIMAGCGANSTKEAIELARFAKKVGAQCQLQVVPYYNKPTQEGQYLHFKSIAEAVDLPLVLYNVPGRTGVDLAPATAGRLAALPRIVALKEAVAGAARVRELRAAAPDLALLSGDDPTAREAIFAGAVGVISVTANVAPRLMADMVAAARRGDAVELEVSEQLVDGEHRAFALADADVDGGLVVRGGREDRKSVV